MTRRKPLPYFANQKLDDIRIDASIAIRALKPLLDHGDLEVVQRASKAIERTYEIILSTDEVRKISKKK